MFCVSKQLVSNIRPFTQLTITLTNGANVSRNGNVDNQGKSHLSHLGFSLEQEHLHISNVYHLRLNKSMFTNQHTLDLPHFSIPRLLLLPVPFSLTLTNDSLHCLLFKQSSKLFFQHQASQISVLLEPSLFLFIQVDNANKNSKNKSAHSSISLLLCSNIRTTD